MSNTSVVSVNSDLTIYNLSTVHISSASATGDVASPERQSGATSPSLQRDAAPSATDTSFQMDSTPVTDSSSLPSDSPPSIKGLSVPITEVSRSGHESSSKMTSCGLLDTHRQDSLEKISSQIKSSSFPSQGFELRENSKCSNTSEVHSASPPKKPPRTLNMCTSERDVVDSVNAETTLDFSNLLSDSQQETNAFCEWDNCDNVDDGAGKEAKPSAIKSNELLRNDCHLVQASLREVPKYNILQDSNKMECVLNCDEKQTKHQGEYLHESKDFLNNPTRMNSSSGDCPVDADDSEQKNSIQTYPAKLLNLNQPSHPDSVNQEKNSFQVYVELFADSGPQQTEDSEDGTSDRGRKDPEETQGVEGEPLETTKLDDGPASPDKPEQPILLPSVIAEVRLRSQASIAHNRYVFRSPSRSPTRKNDLDTLNLLSFENTKFGSLQRKLRNSMRKTSGPRPKAVDFCPSSLKLFVCNEKEYNASLAKLLFSRSSYSSDVEECFNAVRSIKSSSDSIIEYVSKHPLSVTTVIEAFYKQIEQFKHYAAAGKELRNIEVASYDEEHRDLSNLLEKLVVVNDRLPFYCATFQSWLQLMPDEDNVDELRNLVDLLEQIRLNGLIPDSTHDTS